MMHRYIAFSWDHRIAERQALAKMLVGRVKSMLPQWRCALASEGLQVYQIGQRTRSCHAYVLNRNIGIVLGKVFARSTAVDCESREIAFNERETQKIQETKGRHLIEHYWGRYVALLQEHGGVRIRILRDPTGAVPCFLTDFRSIDVICSHIEDCASLGLVNSAIDWDHIAAYLWYRRLVGNHTGLVNVKQIQAGECLAIGADSTTATFYWNPSHVHDMRIVEDRQQAMRILGTTIQRCVAAWASCYDSLLHELSGGLDSAVVLACLSGTSGEVDITCENFFTQDFEGDERGFARKAARLAKVDLVETPLHSSGTLESMLDSTKVATPTLTNLVPEYQLIREDLVKARGIEAVFSGQGGDHFFQQEATLLIAAEYVWHHGIRPDLFGVITDTSRFTGRPIWSVIGKALTSGVLRRHENPYQQKLKRPPLVSDATFDSLDPSDIRHSWVDNAKRLPGGKIHQILNIVDSQNLHHLPSHYADIVHPLISQPIIELCLQIPSYVLTYGGIGRALVRDTFSGMMPPEITTRTTKGATTSYVDALFVRSLPFLREFLLDGVLMGKGVLDRTKTEMALTEASIIRDSRLLFPMLSAVQAEAWLRVWITDGQRAAE